jgi:hypothetical protein
MLNIEPLNWDDLDGKTLKISVSKEKATDIDKEAICVFGFDEKENKLYLLNHIVR